MFRTRVWSLLLLASIASPLAAFQAPELLDNLTVASNGSSLSGALNFQTDLFTGRFAYTVPIVVPEGRGGHQPRLAVTYDSARGNGDLGVGWGLSLPSIRRDTREGVPVRRQPSGQKVYDNAKGFVFESRGAAVRLVPVLVPDPLLAFGDYRAEVDHEFQLFTFLATGEWRITEKNGTQHVLGGGFAHTVPAPLFHTVNAGHVYAWLLKSSTDSNGNQIDYEYQRLPSSTARAYPHRIHYGANTHGAGHNYTVEFAYLPTRGDTIIDYVPGFRLVTSGLLSSIEVKTFATPSRIRRYAFAYESPTASARRSRLDQIVQFGTDESESLPPLSFDYYGASPGFAAPVPWAPLEIPSAFLFDIGWRSVVGTNNSGSNQADTHVGLEDMNRDGLPDRVLRQEPGGQNAYVVQYNTGSGFATPTGSGAPLLVTFPFTAQHADIGWRSLAYNDLPRGQVLSMLLDVDGNGYPDRIEVPRDPGSGKGKFTGDLVTGLGGFFLVNTFDGSSFSVVPPSSDSQLLRLGPYDAPLTNYDGGFLCPVGGNRDTNRPMIQASLIDMNGDGRPDRVRSQANAPWDSFDVRFGTGIVGETTGFAPAVGWPDVQVDNPSFADDPGWRDLFRSNSADTEVGLYDLNGDGLPDRVMRQLSGFTQFRVQFNNGLGFDDLEDWGTLDHQNLGANQALGSPITRGVVGSDTATFSTLIDVNGDGLLDRVMQKSPLPPPTNQARSVFVVQLNSGSGFGATIELAIDSQGLNADARWASPVDANAAADTTVDLLDMNGDGLPDRVMRTAATTTSNLPLVVEPQVYVPADLLHFVKNGIGGQISVNYAPASQYDNYAQAWTTTEERFLGNTGNLTAPMHVVALVDVLNGLNQPSTTTYSYSGGFYDFGAREFRGFHHVTETDPLGTKREFYFHQGGGRDGTSLSEFEDTSKAKAGFPFRVETWGQVGGIYKKFKVLLHKVVVLNPDPSHPAWQWPVIAHSVERDFEGLLTGIRSRAKATTYDTSRGVIGVETDFGEVVFTSAVGATFTDTTPADKLVTSYTYATLDNPTILDRPSRILISQDGSTRVREYTYTYQPDTGNLASRSEWFDTLGTYLVELLDYDDLGNQDYYKNRAGLETTTQYDTTDFNQYPKLQQSGTFTATFEYDARGVLERATDEKGLVVEHRYDKLYRIVETLISSVPGGTPDIWQERFTYTDDGISGGKSNNWILHAVNDGVDTVDGSQTFTTFDGRGRPIQIRSEAEGGAARGTFLFYDARGNVSFRSLPRRFSGSLDPVWLPPPVPGATDGVSTEYDPVGRPFRTTPTPIGGDGASPTGMETREYLIWSERLTDAEGRVKTTSFDAYRRLVQVTENIGATTSVTRYDYDFLGNLVDIWSDTQGANLHTHFDYDSLGSRRRMVDPDLGEWLYTYDSAGRLSTQEDPLDNLLTNGYDARSRVTNVHIDNPNDAKPARDVTYTYDSSPVGSGYTVYNGQLYQVTDDQGFERYGYDHRGRKLKTTRHLDVNNKNYTVIEAFDERGRVTSITYPFNVASVASTYDEVGHLTLVRSTSGTMGPKDFYQATDFNAFGQLLEIVYGNGVASTFGYHTFSHRLASIETQAPSSGPFLQQLSYTYDKVGNVKSIADGLEATTHPPGQSARLDAIQYDDLHRLLSYERNGQPVSFSYSKTGNMLTNAEVVGDPYEYLAPQPHAVTRAGGVDYTYDAAGNVRTRGSQTLAYDEQNRLVEVSASGTTTTFGYSHDGSRLWKRTGTNLHVWIGAHYEEQNNIKLCNVIADGRRVASFIPIVPPGVVPQLKVNYYHHDHVGSTNVVTKQTAQQIAHYEYKAFGADFFTDEAANPLIDPIYRFTDQALDTETGLYYYGARYYDPLIGRFLQPDPLLPNLANPQALNRYSYALNNPLKFVDPTGNFSFAAVIYAALIQGSFYAAQAAITGGDVWEAFKQGAIEGALYSAAGQLLGAARLQSLSESSINKVGKLAKEVDAFGKATNGIDTFAEFTDFYRSLDFAEVLDNVAVGAVKGIANSAVEASLGALLQGGDFSDIARAALSGARSGAGSGLKGGLEKALLEPSKLDVAVTLRNLGKTFAGAAKGAGRDYVKDFAKSYALENVGRPLLDSVVGYYRESFAAPAAAPYPAFGPYDGRLSLHTLLIHGGWPLQRASSTQILELTPQGTRDDER